MSDLEDAVDILDPDICGHAENGYFVDNNLIALIFGLPYGRSTIPSYASRLNEPRDRRPVIVEFRRLSEIEERQAHPRMSK